LLISANGFPEGAKVIFNDPVLFTATNNLQMNKKHKEILRDLPTQLGEAE